MDKMRLGELGRDRMKLAEGLFNYVCPKVRRTNTPYFSRNNMKLIASSNLYTKPYTRRVLRRLLRTLYPLCVKSRGQQIRYW